VWLLELGQLPDTHPAALHSSSSTGQRERVRLKGLWVQIKTERSLTNNHHRQNKLDLGKTVFISCQSKQVWVVKNKYKFKQYLPLLPRLNFTPSFPTPLIPPPQVAETKQN